MKRFTLLNLLTGYCTGLWSNREEAEHYLELLDDFMCWTVDEF